MTRDNRRERAFQHSNVHTASVLLHPLLVTPFLIFLTVGYFLFRTQQATYQNLMTNYLYERTTDSGDGMWSKRSFNHSFPHSFTHPFPHPFTHPFPHCFTHPFPHSFTHSFNHSFAHSFTHPLTHSHTLTHTHTHSHTLTHTHTGVRAHLEDSTTLQEVKESLLAFFFLWRGAAERAMVCADGGGGEGKAKQAHVCSRSSTAACLLHPHPHCFLPTPLPDVGGLGRDCGAVSPPY